MKKNIIMLKKNQGRYYTSNNINLSLSLSHLGNLNSILIGIMLGDGSLYRSSPTSNVRFEIGELFRDYMNNPVKALKVKGKTKSYINYWFKTKSLPIFVQYFDIFYQFDKDLNKYVKIVPKNISGRSALFGILPMGSAK